MLNKVLRAAVFIVIAALVLAGVAFAHPGNGKTGKHATKVAVVKAKAKKSKKSAFANVRGTILLAKESSSATKSIECSSCGSSVVVTATVVGKSTTETTIALAHAHLRLIAVNVKGKKCGTTAYAAQTNKCGKFAIKHVRKGTYALKVWAKNVKPTCFTIAITDTGAVCVVGPCPVKAKAKKLCPKAAS